LPSREGPPNRRPTAEAEEEIPSLEDLLPERPPLWQANARAAAERALSAGVPSEALAVFARWWEIESWLRLLAYLELRAARGQAWAEVLPNRAAHFAERDAENAYMPSADATNVLAYLDAGELFELLGKQEVWPLVQYALPGKRRWEGQVELLRTVRNRTAHLRRPHSDDLARLEQALRDLERGARAGLEAFNRQSPLTDASDPLHMAWVEGQHKDARRLIRHADRNYDVGFGLFESWRPWVHSVDAARRKGRLIHASWYLRDGAGLAPAAFWSDASLDNRGIRELLVVVVHDSDASVTVTFSAADDPAVVADAIGACFDLVLRHRERHPSPPWRRRWYLDAQGLDWRVRVGDALVLASYDQPFSVFRAGPT
jgi:hypothetical protein